MKSHILATLIIISVQCQQAVAVVKSIPQWQKICAVVGIVLILIAAVLYFTRNRDINMRQILREYITPSQAEITFVNFKNEFDPRV